MIAVIEEGRGTRDIHVEVPRLFKVGIGVQQPKVGARGRQQRRGHFGMSCSSYERRGPIVKRSIHTCRAKVPVVGRLVAENEEDAKACNETTDLCPSPVVRYSHRTVLFGIVNSQAEELFRVTAGVFIEDSKRRHSQAAVADAVPVTGNVIPPPPERCGSVGVSLNSRLQPIGNEGGDDFTPLIRSPHVV